MHKCNSINRERRVVLFVYSYFEFSFKFILASAYIHGADIRFDNCCASFSALYILPAPAHAARHHGRLGLLKRWEEKEAEIKLKQTKAANREAELKVHAVRKAEAEADRKQKDRAKQKSAALDAKRKEATNAILVRIVVYTGRSRSRLCICATH